MGLGNLRASRLSILIFSIIVPIYILITFFTFDFQLAWLPSSIRDYNLIWILVKYITPLLFTTGWIYWHIILGTRMADTIDLIGEDSSFISTNYLLFYGLNAVILLFIYLIPILTPIISVLAWMSLIYRLTTGSKDWEDISSFGQGVIKFFMVLISIPVLFCTVLVVPELLQMSNNLFQGFWLQYVEPLYYFSLSLGVALSIGKFVFLYLEGVHEVERGTQDLPPQTRLNVYFLEFLILFFLVFLKYYEIEIVQIFYAAGAFISILVSFINLIKGKNQMGDFRDNPTGIFLFAIFILLSYLFRNAELGRLAIIIISALLFGGVFLLYFIGHPDLEKD